MRVVSGSLPGQPVPVQYVKYVKDGQGMVHAVWVLNNTEARLAALRLYRLPPKPGSRQSPASPTICMYSGASPRS